MSLLFLSVNFNLYICVYTFWLLLLQNKNNNKWVEFGWGIYFMGQRILSPNVNLMKEISGKIEVTRQFIIFLVVHIIEKYAFFL